MSLELYIGDSKTFALPMTWDGAAYTPEDDETFIFTAKWCADDTDEFAVIQKSTGAGVTVSGTTASVAIIRDDTVDLTRYGYLQCDIQATRLDGSTRTVWIDRILLVRDITRLSQTSVPVVTTETPLPVVTESTMQESIAEATDADPLDGTEKFGVERGGSLLSTTLTKIKNFVLTFLGDSATLDVGTALGTVAAGDHTHLLDFLDGPNGAADGRVLTPDGVGPGVQWRNLAATEITGLGDSATLDVGTTAGTVAAGNDERLSDSRTPTAHVASHATGGSDEITPADIGAETPAGAQAKVDALGYVFVNKGTFDASSGSTVPINSPQIGWAYRVTVAGSIPENGDVNVGDWVIAIATSIDTFLGDNWRVLYGQNTIDALKAKGALADSAVQPAAITTDADDRTLALTDAWDYIRFTNATATVLTIPTNASVAFPIGTQIYCRRSASAGAITLSNAGVTVNGGANISSVPQSGNFALVKIDTDTWDFI